MITEGWFFLCLIDTIWCDPSFEPSWWDSSDEGYNICFYAKWTKIIPSYHQIPPLIYRGLSELHIRYWLYIGGGIGVDFISVCMLTRADILHYLCRKPTKKNICILFRTHSVLKFWNWISILQYCFSTLSLIRHDQRFKFLVQEILILH